MSTTETQLPAFLRLEPEGGGRYRVPAREGAARDVVNGVQLMAWAMAASVSEGLGEQAVKSAHGVFSRPAALSAPVEFELDRFYRGRAFGADTVTVTQGGKNVARIQLLFSADEPDLIRHADEMPPVPGPDEAEPFPASAVAVPDVEVRIVGGVDYVSSDHPLLPPETFLWVRSTVPITGRVPNQAVLTACTGTMLIGTAMLPHEGIGQDRAHRTISTGVVGHTMAFHEPFELGAWVLLAQESVYAGRGRTHGRARVFGDDGRLVASYVQDAMIRRFTDAKDHSSESRTIM